MTSVFFSFVLKNWWMMELLKELMCLSTHYSVEPNLNQYVYTYIIFKCEIASTMFSACIQNICNFEFLCLKISNI